jgi:hypothetical protein
MGFRCPDKGRLRKPIFMVDISPALISSRRVTGIAEYSPGKCVVQETTRYESALFLLSGRYPGRKKGS